MRGIRERLFSVAVDCHRAIILDAIDEAILKHYLSSSAVKRVSEQISGLN